MFRDRVGEGWFATVWLAEWRNVRIAVKHLIVSDQMNDNEVETRTRIFHEEMRIMSLVPAHPHVMRLSGTSPSQEVRNTNMELCIWNFLLCFLLFVFFFDQKNHY